MARTETFLELPGISARKVVRVILLGERQASMLRRMRTMRGVWCEDCGWGWDKPSDDLQIFRSLERKKLVEHYDHKYPGRQSPVHGFKITELGRTCGISEIRRRDDY